MKKEVKQLLKEYRYYGLDTCATDGLCASECPVNINTGELVKRLRNEQHGHFANAMAGRVSRNFKTVEKAGRFSIRIISFIDHFLNGRIVGRVTTALHKIIPAIPVWMAAVGKPSRYIAHEPVRPEAVYFTACINRLMSSHQKGKPSLQETFLNLCRKAGIEVLLPKNISGYCCGQPFSSKGYKEAAFLMEYKTIDALLKWTNNGALPVVIDFTSCTYTFLQNQSGLSPEFKEKISRLRLVDSIQFLKDTILPRISISKKIRVAAIHPVCSATKLNLTGPFEMIAKACADQVIKPANAGCCGMAGDRGFFVPELTTSATQLELDELKGQPCDGYYASSTTCEIALTENSGNRYEHIMYLMDEVSDE